jgi:two-component system copper resistance phosphate regulon response regulator CusR
MACYMQAIFFRRTFKNLFFNLILSPITRNSSFMEKRKCIVVIEDESMVQQSLLENLTHNGFDVFAYVTAEEAMQSDIVDIADAVIMDIRLPGINGWEATAKIKAGNSGIPIIMLTAYSDLNYRVQGFETGADDYIIKPFFMEELLARLKAVLKRYEMIPGGKRFYEVGDLNIDMKGKVVHRDKQPIRLSPTEFNILALLADKAGAPVHKDEIIKEVWKGKYSLGDNIVEVYINLLRNKIDKPFSRKLIHTKPGFGYYISETQ